MQLIGVWEVGLGFLERIAALAIYAAALAMVSIASNALRRYGKVISHGPLIGFRGLMGIKNCASCHERL